MTKIMLVEDDKSLREIYGVRLLAEGYDIVSAGDGEEALAMAIKERPVLIITDVMMPRISGFDMLDILRSTTETKNIKVIMMTALSSEDQRKHGEQLGADRYLVKSQVGIEDVVRVVHEVLGDKPAAAPGAPAAPPAAGTPAAPPRPAAPTPPNPVSAATAAAAAAPTLPAPAPTPSVTTQPRTMASQQPRTMNDVAPPQQPATPPVAPHPAATAQPAQAVHTTAMPPASTTTPGAPSTRQRVIQPINDPTAKVDINSLLDKELAREAGVDMNSRPHVATAQQEKAEIQNELSKTIPPAPPAVQQASAPVPPTPRPPVQAPQRPPTAPLPPRQDGTQAS